VAAKSEVSDGSLLLRVPFLLVNAPSCHLSLVLASVVQGDAVNCNKGQFSFLFLARVTMGWVGRKNRESIHSLINSPGITEKIFDSS